MINLPRDDLGVQRLKEANAARSATAPVSPVTTGSIVGSQPSPTPAIPVAPPEERRRVERRHGQGRRGQSQPTLLDTRSHYERRTHERRQQATPQGEHYHPLGINVYI